MTTIAYFFGYEPDHRIISLGVHMSKMVFKFPICIIVNTIIIVKFFVRVMK